MASTGTVARPRRETGRGREQTNETVYAARADFVRRMGFRQLLGLTTR